MSWPKSCHWIFVLFVLLAKSLCFFAEIKCYPSIKIVLLQIFSCFRYLWQIHIALMLPQFSVALCLCMSAYVKKGMAGIRQASEGSFTELEEAPLFPHVLLRTIMWRLLPVTENDFCILQAGQQFSHPLHTPAHDVADHRRVVIFIWFHHC